MHNNLVKCPNCGTEINVADILYHQIEESVNLKFKRQIEVKEKEYISKEKKMKTELAASIEKEMKEKYEDIDMQRKKEIDEKNEQLKEMNKWKLESIKLKKEKSEIESRVKKEVEATMKKTLNEEMNIFKKKIETDNERLLKEKDIKISQLVKSATELKRKAEQGSVQLQGEAQEICIEQWLKKMFPQDVILEVKKGINGADCMQVVINSGKECAKICYESKRTKVFKHSWVEKLRDDMIRAKANVGVIITEAMPPGKQDIDVIDGIWICSYASSRSLCFVIREFVVKAYEIYSTGKGKGGKMERIYDYLNSDEFKMNIKILFGKLTEMKSQIEKEKTDTIKLWKKREELIEAMLKSASNVFMRVGQIAGNTDNNIYLIDEVYYQDEKL